MRERRQEFSYKKGRIGSKIVTLNKLDKTNKA
jgi:hypothetical protein